MYINEFEMNFFFFYYCLSTDCYVVFCFLFFLLLLMDGRYWRSKTILITVLFFFSFLLGCSFLTYISRHSFYFFFFFFYFIRIRFDRYRLYQMRSCVVKRTRQVKIYEWLVEMSFISLLLLNRKDVNYMNLIWLYSDVGNKCLSYKCNNR